MAGQESPFLGSADPPGGDVPTAGAAQDFLALSGLSCLQGTRVEPSVPPKSR